MAQGFQLPKVSIGEIAGRLLSVGLPLGALFLAFSLVASGPLLNWFTTVFLMSAIAFNALTRAALSKAQERSKQSFLGFVLRVMMMLLRVRFLTNPFTLRVIGSISFGLAVATLDWLLALFLVGPLGTSLEWPPTVIGLVSLGVVLMGTYFAIFYLRSRRQNAGSHTWSDISDEYEKWKGRPLSVPALELGPKSRAFFQAAGRTLLTLIVRALAIWGMPLVFADWRGGLSFLLALLTAAVAPEYVIAAVRYALDHGDSNTPENFEDPNPNERNAS